MQVWVRWECAFPEVLGSVLGAAVGLCVVVLPYGVSGR